MQRDHYNEGFGVYLMIYFRIEGLLIEVLVIG